MHRRIVQLLSLLILVSMGCKRTPDKEARAEPETKPTVVGTTSADQAIDEVPSSETDELDSDRTTVQLDIRKNLEAVYSGDLDTVIGYTHPKVIALLGGESKARTALRDALAPILRSNMKVESLDFPEPPTLLETEASQFVIVPTHIIISSNGQRAESFNFQLGHRSSRDAPWKYIEGSRINQNNVRSYFPDFPSDYEFPSTSRKRLP